MRNDGLTGDYMKCDGALWFLCEDRNYDPARTGGRSWGW